MDRRARRARGWQARLGFALAALPLVALACHHAYAVEEDTKVVRVEETWELVVGTPDSDTSGPQVTCVMSPTENLNGLYSIFTLNHLSHPAFTAGGLQLQVWSGESTLTAKKHPNQGLLATPGETIRWTTKMSLFDGVLVFDVDDGSSTTWGNFGTNGYLWASNASSLANLNGYSPDVSVAKSGVNFASNRVQSLVLKKVRLVLESGQTLDDNTPRVVHQQN